jgi:hypothetical protein
MNPTMLRLVVNDGRPLNRLRLARAHIEVAIAHLNNEAQARVPSCRGHASAEANALRVLVQALADIRNELTDTRRPAPDGAELIRGLDVLGWVD